MQVIKKIAIRAILYPLVVLVLLAGGIVIALQIPAVQTRAVQYATKKLSAMLNFPISVEGVRIKWFDTLTLSGVKIVDRGNRPMIEVAELDVDFALQSLLDTANINVDQATLHNPRVRLVVDKQTGDLNMDDFIAAINELTASKDTTTRVKTGPSQAFSIDRVSLQNTIFSYSDDREDSLGQKGGPQAFDYYHFTLDSLYINADRFRIVDDTIEVGINNLHAVERTSRLRIHEFSTFFRYTKRSMTFDDFFARINQSTLRKRFAMNYPNGTRDFGDFNDQIQLEADLDSTVIHSQDLALFAPDLYAYQEDWRIKGSFKGKVTSFRIKNMDFYFGLSSHLKGNVRFEGLPNLKETFINLDLQKSVVDAPDVKQYVDEESYRIVQKFGRVDLRAKFVGFPRDFVANGAFNTRLGNLVTDINLKLNKVASKSTYEGKLKTTGFELGKLIDNPETIQKVDMSGHVKGQGLTLEDANLRVNANFDRLGLNYYDYRQIRVEGDLQKGFFDGTISARDPNLVFNLSGEIALTSKPQYVNVAGRIEKANLKALRLVGEELSLQTELDVSVEGLTLDDIVGQADFRNMAFVYHNRSLNVDTLSLFSSKNDSARSFRLQSDLLTVDAKGKFEFTQAAGDIDMLLNEYILSFTGTQLEKEAYYVKKRKKSTGIRKKYQIDYDVNLKNINPIVALFEPSIYVSQNTGLDGKFINGPTSILSFNSRIDTLLYKNYQFYESTVDVSTSKLSDSVNVLASAFLSSERQQLNGFAPTENIAMEGIWNEDRIDFTGGIRQSKSTNQANLKGALKFMSDGLLIQFKPSQFVILDNEWNIAKDNTITIKREEVTFQNLRVSNKRQIISLNGALSTNPETPAELQVQDFNLATLAPLIGRNVKGTLNGYLQARNVYDTLNIDSEMNLEELVIDRFLIGNISGETKWDETERRIKTNYQIDRMGKQIMSIRGTYDPNAQDKEKSLNMVAELRQADLELIEPFVKDFISKVSGNASGKIKIGGSFSSPLLKGELTIRKGRMKYDYLNTFFRFEDKIYFSENEIGTKQLRLTDDEGHGAILQGGVFHDGFKDFVLDLNARLENFKILNTDEKSGETYYGTAFATGTANLFGPINNLTIKAVATSNKGTKIYIPLDRSETIEHQDYIQFVSRTQQSDTAQNAIKKINLSGIKLDLSFDITPDAYCEIIFDQQTGDIIKATGNGKINMQIDSHGEFTMMGNYEIEAGTYNFTFMNVINKQFAIRPNSRITWTGDPYSAILNIHAAYVQQTSLSPILTLDESKKNDPQYARRYPVSVLMDLTGNLLTPQIDLGIEINDYPKTGEFLQGVTSFQSYLLSDNQEMSRQAFSLMVLRQLSRPRSFEGTGAIGSNVSELLSNQFSNWISQVDENLQVDFNLNGLDQNAINNFQLRLSYAVNQRLRITRDGGFNNNGNSADARNVLGDWTIEYWLSKDGKFRMKVYNRNNQNVIGNAVGNSIATTSAGFSLLHTQSFNRFGELIKPKKKKKMLEIPVEEEAPTPPVGKQSNEPKPSAPPASKADDRKPQPLDSGHDK
jgi:hypothetical protein